MLNQTSHTALTRRKFAQLSGLATGSLLIPESRSAVPPADVSLEVAPYILEASPKHQIKTLAYNGQVPGPVIRMRENQELTVELRNSANVPEVVHWHGLYLPADIDGAMEEGTPMIAAGASKRYVMTPRPAGFRWYHTHTFAGNDLTKAQYGGLHGFLLVEASLHSAPYDREVFLGLHDWRGHFMGSDDGYMNPVYDVTTINGKMLGFGEPVRVKRGQRVMMHILNSSPTEVHWISLSGHSLEVVALDGNPVPQRKAVTMVRLAPAERVSAIVEMNNPGVWVLGEVRKHVQATGMGIVVEYADSTGKPVWVQPNELLWNYRQFAETAVRNSETTAKTFKLVFDSKFQGHGNEELWRINGLPYPLNSTQQTSPLLYEGERYRLVMSNKSLDDHPIHLHRHTFEIKRLEDGSGISGLRKDVVLVPAGKTIEVEFVANNRGNTLLHCHQQDHMDRGFMMVFRYA